MSTAITTTAKHAIAVRGRKPSFPSEAATICGEGVSPAARAAAIGLAPGIAIATLSADEGRRLGSSSRHRRMTRSMAASRFLTRSEGLDEESPRRLPVNIS